MTVSLLTSPTYSRPGFFAAVNAERLKFFSLKSGPVTTAGLGVAIVLVALLSSLSLIAPPSNPNPNAAPISSVTSLRFVDAVLWMAIVYAVVAALFATSEYTSKHIRLSLLAVPRRTPLLLAKVWVIGVLGFAVGAVSALAAMLVPVPILAGSAVSYEVDPQLLGTLTLASGLFLALTGVVSLCVAMLVRNVIVAILIPVLLFSIVPSILESIGSSAVTAVVGYLPTIAGRVLLTAFENPAGLTGWIGMAVLAAWAVVFTALAAVVLKVRDA